MSIQAVVANTNPLAQVKQETSKSKDTDKNSQVLTNEIEKPNSLNEVIDNAIPVDLESSVDELNKAVQNIQRDIHFSIHDETGESVIQVIDRKTDEVVKQFPPEAVLKVSEKLQGLQGVLFEEEA